MKTVHKKLAELPLTITNEGATIIPLNELARSVGMTPRDVLVNFRLINPEVLSATLEADRKPILVEVFSKYDEFPLVVELGIIKPHLNSKKLYVTFEFALLVILAKQLGAQRAIATTEKRYHQRYKNAFILHSNYYPKGDRIDAIHVIAVNSEGGAVCSLG